MNRIAALLRVHALTFFCWAIAFFFWKDYLTHPRQTVTRQDLVSFSGELEQAGTYISLPSGATGPHYLMLKGANRMFDVPFVKDFDEIVDAPKGTPITVTHSREVDPSISGEGVVPFSLQYNGKEYIAQDEAIDSYNKRLTGKRNTAAVLTLGGFGLLGIMEFIRRRFLRR